MPAKPAKRAKVEPKPDFKAGLDYWASVEASNNGVLGGFGNGDVPRLDALASRLFLLSLIPRLSSVPSSIKPLESDSTPSSSSRRTRALDVGAGIGRVTSSVLIHLLDTIEVLEPAPHFLAQAVQASESWKGLSSSSSSSTEKEKAARFWEGGLAGFDPRNPGATAKEVARKGLWAGAESEDGKNVEYDVIWCQWCVGHLSTPDLVSFLKLAKLALIPCHPDAVIVVKENLCEDDPKDGERGSVVFDDEDSSLTRSDKAFRFAFKEAGLTIIREEIQTGFPTELFPVKMYALR